MTGALEGIRVLDFGQYVAGPLAAMLLADQGADVIRIDPPGGPRWATTGRSPRLSRTPVRPGAPASAPGADGADILEEAGLAFEMPALVNSGVLVEKL